jgi:hypothetical protein
VAELRREHDPFAPTAQQLAEEALARAAVAVDRRARAVSVDVGRVEERDAGVQRRVDDRARALEVEPSAEVVAAEPDARDDEWTESGQSQRL